MAHSGRVALLSVCFIAIITGSLAQCVNGISAHLFEDRIPSRSSRGLSDQFQQCRTVYRYQTSKNGSDRITQKPSIRFGPTTLPALANITVDVSTTYQEILGFGGAFTDASAEVFAQLNPKLQRQVIDAYFSKNGNRYSVCRTNIQSCDFSSASYAFAETPGDYSISNFSIAHNLNYMVPFIKTAMEQSYYPVRLFGTPWSPPAWMKRNGAMDGSDSPGLINDSKIYSAWALLLSKFVSAYKALGIEFWGITVQNESEFAAPWEACVYNPEQQRDFIRDYFGPRFRKDHPNVKIMSYDHNKDHVVEWVKTIMGDPETRKYVDGTAFHWYSGSQFENLAAAHEAAPDRFLLGTEACTCPPDPNDWTKGEKYAYDIMGDLNNWAVGWTDWNMLLDKQGGPNHLNNFCDAPIIADVAAQSISFQNPYYYMGQITRFILPGARIIKTTSTLSQDQLSVVSALNPDGSVAVVLLNQSESPISINLIDKGVAANSVVPARSIVTLTYFR